MLHAPSLCKDKGSPTLMLHWAMNVCSTQNKGNQKKEILDQRSKDSNQELPNYKTYRIWQAIAAVTPLDTPHPLLHQICTLMETKCATSQAEMCAAEWSVWARRCETPPDKKSEFYAPQPSGQPPCPAARGLSRCRPCCSEALPRSPSLHSANREVRLINGASSTKRQQRSDHTPRTFSSNREIFCFNSATYWECSASLILAIMRFSFI